MSKEWRDAIIKRDRERCTNCGRNIEELDQLDIDHTVPQGVGGSDSFSNCKALCRKCHEAKHGEGIAPTVRFESTCDMSQSEFIRFRHFLNEILPALARNSGVRLQPKYNLNDKKAWHIPVGDIRQLDIAITDSDERYKSLQLKEYM